MITIELNNIPLEGIREINNADQEPIVTRESFFRRVQTHVCTKKFLLDASCCLAIGVIGSTVAAITTKNMYNQLGYATAISSWGLIGSSVFIITRQISNYFLARSNSLQITEDLKLTREAEVLPYNQLPISTDEYDLINACCLLTLEEGLDIKEPVICTDNKIYSYPALKESYIALGEIIPSNRQKLNWNEVFRITIKDIPNLPQNNRG